MTEVACVGIAVLDRLYRIGTHPTAPGKYRASDRSVVGGGVAANAAVTIARLGGRARFFGVLGDDETGRLIRAGLESEGVDIAGVQEIAGGLSPESIVQIDDQGERLIVNHASPDLFQLATRPDTEPMRNASAVLVDMRWQAGAISALEAASSLGIPGIVDCDHDPDDTPGILESASHIVFASTTLVRWTSESDVERALTIAHDRTGAWVAATDGANGTTFLADDGAKRVPAFPVDAVDTLGAGDVFHGAFALAVAEGRSVEEAMRWASAAAAVKCQRFGGRSGIPTRDDVQRFLEER